MDKFLSCQRRRPQHVLTQPHLWRFISLFGCGSFTSDGAPSIARNMRPCRPAGLAQDGAAGAGWDSHLIHSVPVPPRRGGAGHARLDSQARAARRFLPPALDSPSPLEAPSLSLPPPSSGTVGEASVDQERAGSVNTALTSDWHIVASSLRPRCASAIGGKEVDKRRFRSGFEPAFDR